MSTDTQAIDPLAHMGHAELFHHLLNSKYVPAFMEKQRYESQRRMHAFADDVSITVCGEELRLMTPHDLHLLDREENAFVCAKEPTLQDLQWFLWCLSIQNDGTASLRNNWRRGRLYARVEALPDALEAFSDVYEYLERLWLEDPPETGKDGAGEAKKKKDPPSVYCLAPLMVNVAMALNGSSVDPMSGKLLGHTPIPRLLQYQRCGIEAKTGEREATAFDSLKSKCLEEVNQIIAERNKKA